MNKQEAINQVKLLKARETFMSETIWVKQDDAIDIISQINEPQKPVVPKFVAEWLKENRHAHTLLKVLNAADEERITPSIVNDWILENQREFIMAWFFGLKLSI